VFFGGGTPSLLTPDQLERILRTLYEVFVIAPDSEVTIETNPGTVTPEKLAAFRALGVNRLSIGVQSLQESDLRFLGRIHDGSQALACVRMAREAGFDNLSIDLIYALPGQTRTMWAETLKKGLALRPDHVSAYSLIVEEHTPLSRMVAAKEVSPLGVDMEAALFEDTMEMMDRHGFEHYEVSNYARPGRRSRHNCAYWSHANYIGMGPSAHSFWQEAEGGVATRWSNCANISTYCEKLACEELPVAFRETLSARQLLNERIFLGLRSDGIDLSRLRQDSSLVFPPDRDDLVRTLVEEGKATIEGQKLRLTAAGFLLCDEIAHRMMI
jgi:oxygen-independent coproporphyrinogen-3 oxidase